jgi:SAM-dependent methyltransferase
MRGAELLAWISSRPPETREADVERHLGIEAHDVSSASPGRHLIGYHASGVDAILRVIAEAPVTPNDVVVDLGAGLGKVLLLTQLITGARARGVEIQAPLVERARAAAARLGASVELSHGDVREADLDDGTVFFLYNPFTEPVLGQALARLHEIARRRAIVVCALAVDLEPRAPWLVPRSTGDFWLTIYDSARP